VLVRQPVASNGDIRSICWICTDWYALVTCIGSLY